MLPTDEIASFAMWLTLAWLLTMLIALYEERRVWLAANPRTAAYMRGLKGRNPYPSWSPFEVDYALLEPGLASTSVWLHRVYLRTGFAEALGLPESLWEEGPIGFVAESGWLFRAAVPLALAMVL